MHSFARGIANKKRSIATQADGGKKYSENKKSRPKHEDFKIRDFYKGQRILTSAGPALLMSRRVVPLTHSLLYHTSDVIGDQILPSCHIASAIALGVKGLVAEGAAFLYKGQFHKSHYSEIHPSRITPQVQAGARYLERTEFRAALTLYTMVFALVC